MSKNIELLESALELVKKYPYLDVEVKISIKDTPASEAKVEPPQPKKTVKEDPAKKIEKATKAANEIEKVVKEIGSQSVDEFDATLDTQEKGTVKPDPKVTGEKKANPKKDIEPVEAATEDDSDENEDASQKVILQDGQEHCVACQGTGIDSKGNKCRICKGTGIKQEEKVHQIPSKEEKKIDAEIEDEEKSEDDDWDF